MTFKEFSSFLTLLCCVITQAQEASEIILFDFTSENGQYKMTNPINISNFKGYDNQPCFTEDGKHILFSSIRNGQADIARYDVEEGYRIWITNTKNISEHSPAPYPKKKKNFTCIQFREDETQVLCKYFYKNKTPQPILPHTNIAYYVWINAKSLAAYTLDDIDKLKVVNLKYNIKYPIQENIGRSLNRVPQNDLTQDQLISFIDKKHDTPEIYTIDPRSSDVKYLTDALDGSEDFTWTKDGVLLMAKDNQVFKFHPGQDQSWEPISIESNIDLSFITRLAISPLGNKIAIVIAEE